MPVLGRIQTRMSSEHTSPSHQRLRTSFAAAAKLIDPRLLGMALPFFCSDLVARINVSNRVEAQLIYHLTYSSLLFIIAIVAIYRQHRHQEIMPRFRVISSLGSLMLCITYILLALALTLQMRDLFIVAAITGSIGLANCYIKWFSLFPRVSIRVATVSLLLSYSLGSFLRLLLSYTAPLVSLMLAAGAVLVFQVVFLRIWESFNNSSKVASSTTPESPETSSPQTGSQTGLQTDARGLLPFVVILMLYSCILALVRAVNVDTQYFITPNTVNLILRTSFPLVLLPFVIQGKWTIRFATLYQLSLILVVTAVFLIRLFSESNTVLAIGLTSFIRGLIILFLFLALVQIVQDKKYNPLTVIGIGWGAYVLAQGIGLLFYLSFGFTLDDGLALNITFLLVALSILVLLLVNRRGTQAAAMPPLSPSSPETATSINGGERDDEHFAHFRHHYGLTERELEVLALICQGRSKRYIADAFVISENTVRGHVKNLHTKCGVHTKQQLIDLFESFV